MPAGGTWTAQNKVRPGVYINFNSVPAPTSQLGSSGTIITLLPMDWGPAEELIVLTGEELLNGKSREKIGYYYNDSESLPYRLALQHCYQMLIYRADEGGLKATYTQGDPNDDPDNPQDPLQFTMTAKYAGIAGNSITVVTQADRPAAGKVTMSILYQGAVKETYVLDHNIGQLASIDSAWLDFDVVEGQEAAAIPISAGLVLEGGTNGTLDYSTVLPEFQDIAKLRDWAIMALPTTDDNAVNSSIQFIQDLRNTDGKMVSLAIATENPAAEPPTDDEAVIASCQGYKTANFTVTPELFTLQVAGMFAGTALGVSNTCAEIPNATEIVNQLTDGLITDYLQSGWFILSYRSDGVVVVESDVNTLHTFTAERPKEYSKNMVIRLLNTIAQEASLIFIRDFAGKVRANKTGRDLFKSRMVSYFTNLQDSDAIINFTADDINVYEGEQPEGVVMDVAIQPVGAMEKLYLTINIIA